MVAVSVVCQRDVAEQHSEIPGIGDARMAESAKEAVAISAQAAKDPNNHLAMCSVRLQGLSSAPPQILWEDLNVNTN